MAFQDRELTCRECGSAFIFTTGEQEFYASKGLQHDPVRCPSCRQTRRTTRMDDREEAPSYGIYVSWGGRTPRQIHRASCSGCGQSAEVPFMPRGDRPVFCSDCYRRETERQEAAAAAAEELAAVVTVRTTAADLVGDGHDEPQHSLED